MTRYVGKWSKLQLLYTSRFSATGRAKSGRQQGVETFSTSQGKLTLQQDDALSFRYIYLWLCCLFDWTFSGSAHSEEASPRQLCMLTRSGRTVFSVGRTLTLIDVGVVKPRLAPNIVGQVLHGTGSNPFWPHVGLDMWKAALHSIM
ncbi:unnamed protein product [Symbiodinium microadriaticum]|nr:unnamed protein product [Symbiodinium microadriaticum]CAE7946411.1 unnamed protein product [Symbiodinium sp. KB8]